MFVEFQREMQGTRLDAAMEQQATNRATTTVAWQDARTRQAIDEPPRPLGSPGVEWPWTVDTDGTTGRGIIRRIDAGGPIMARGIG